jgi:hypothetical protein
MHSGARRTASVLVVEEKEREHIQLPEIARTRVAALLRKRKGSYFAIAVGRSLDGRSSMKKHALQ